MATICRALCFCTSRGTKIFPLQGHVSKWWMESLLSCNTQLHWYNVHSQNIWLTKEKLPKYSLPTEALGKSYEIRAVIHWHSLCVNLQSRWLKKSNKDASVFLQRIIFPSNNHHKQVKHWFRAFFFRLKNTNPSFLNQFWDWIWFHTTHSYLMKYLTQRLTSTGSPK